MTYNFEGHNGKVPMTKLRIKFVSERLGFRNGYIIDEHGCGQNTEAVCTVPVRYHDWFIEWLERQEFEYPVPLTSCYLKDPVETG